MTEHVIQRIMLGQFSREYDLVIMRLVLLATFRTGVEAPFKPKVDGVELALRTSYDRLNESLPV